MSVILRVGAVKPNETQELHYGSGDEACNAYSDADVLDIPLPEHTYQRPLPPTSSASQSVTGYIGLPYQDHNYPMLPPPSPPRPPTPRPPSPFEDSGMVQMEEEVKTTPLVSVVEEVVEDSITRCICGYLHDDGYMICCDKCSVWQHIDCMGVDRNNIPDSYYCELCQPRVLDAVKAKAMQKRKREELAARNVLSDSSATDTDPEEAANALASMGKKLPINKKKSLKQKRNSNSKAKEKPPLKLKIRKALAQKVKKPGKKEKENMTSAKPPKKLVKTPEGHRVKKEKIKRSPLSLEDMTGDLWNSNFSPWTDSYSYAESNHYDPSVKDFVSSSKRASQVVVVSSTMPDQLRPHLTCVADVKKNRKGLRVLEEIPAGQAIIEYKGKVILRQDYDQEHSSSYLERLQPFVLFYSKLEVDICIDARTFGNEARFVRRSCTPNAEVKHVMSQGKLNFIIMSKKDILCGYEVTIPFDYNYKDCLFCIECACLKNNCAVAKYWKKRKNSQKALEKDGGIKRRRQISGSEASKSFSPETTPMSPPIGSPRKNSISPIKTSPALSPNKMSSPVKLSNVSTLLAASAILDGQLDMASGFDLDVDSLQNVTAPRTPHKSATSSRRSSRMTEESAKEEKNVATSPTKDKVNKSKETTKPKGKEKDKTSVNQTIEFKKEIRLSYRRQSQEDVDEIVDQKVDSSYAAHSSGTECEESSATADQNQKKMTREERKLDAIMKVFEKMEKREERRKEAMARGDPGSKRCSTETKVQKKDDQSGTPSNSSLPDQLIDKKLSLKEEPSTNITNDGGSKSEVSLSPGSKNEQDHSKLLLDSEVRHEKDDVPQLQTSGKTDGNHPGISPTSPVNHHDTRLGSLDSSSKVHKKPGKRKRRRSRAQSTAAIVSDTASVSTDESNSNSISIPAPISVPVTPVSTPITTPLPSEEPDAEAFKYVKTKKHLFDEWSHKHEDGLKEEMFVQCLPNPHINPMDHLQRRNSQSSGGGIKGSDTGGGSAKKRWLRQAMHEVPAPVVYNHSLSVSTDSGHASPVHGSSSPNPGAGLGSPVSGSPLDFVTPLKKRRLMRESLSNETVTSPSAGVLTESINSLGVSIAPKTNGVRHMLPPTRHSTDDVRATLEIS